MNIYIVSATDFEVQPLLDFCKTLKQANGAYLLQEHQLFIHTHGVGLLAATYNLTQIAQLQPDLIIQAGIAGCFKKEHALGNVYVVGADRLADLGAEDNETYLDVFELNLVNKNEAPYDNGWLFNTQNNYPNFFKGLLHVNAITVNTVSGKQSTIDKYAFKYKPTLESMEGAALHYVALQNNIPFVQLRAVSNYVTIRNKAIWEIPLAIENLNKILLEFINSLNT